MTNPDLKAQADTLQDRLIEEVDGIDPLSSREDLEREILMLRLAVKRHAELRDKQAAALRHAAQERESIAALMIQNGYSTGHGDTALDLAKELLETANEYSDRIGELEGLQVLCEEHQGLKQFFRGCPYCVGDDVALMVERIAELEAALTDLVQMCDDTGRQQHVPETTRELIK